MTKLIVTPWFVVILSRLIEQMRILTIAGVLGVSLAFGCAGPHPPNLPSRTATPTHVAPPPSTQPDDKLRGKLLEEWRQSQAEMHLQAVRHAWETVRQQLTPEQAAEVPETALFFDSADDTPFGFFANSKSSLNPVPRVTITLGGVRTAQFVCEASVIFDEFLEPRRGDDGFFAQYSAYLAQRPDFIHLRSPTEVLGWAYDDVPRTSRERVLNNYLECLYFVIAHEIGHVVMQHPGCDPDESDPDKLAMSRYREAQADQFAFRILYKMGYTAVPTLQLFVAWTVTAEGLAPIPGAGTHPAEMSRVTAALDFLLALAEVKDASPAVRGQIVQARLGMYKFALALEDPKLRDQMKQTILHLTPDALARPRPAAIQRTH